MQKYYAVRKGKNPGIYTSWEECSKQVLGFQDAEYKSFSSEEDAKNYILNISLSSGNSDTFAYVDGSYNQTTTEYSFGAVLFLNGEELRFSKKYDADEYSQFRNVAGEVKGAGFMINYCINHGVKSLDLYYDYEGIHSWYEGLWKANNSLTITYQEFARKAKEKINVNFIKVKSHTNVKYNDIVDRLAKDALGIK